MSTHSKDVSMVDSLMTDDDDQQRNTCAAYYGPFMHLLELPTSWSPKEKEKSTHLELNSSLLRVTYRPTSKDGNEAGLVRSNRPIPSACGIFYFETKVISKGKDGYIGIGVCPQNMLLSRLPGWEKNSYGYHGDDGNLFKGAGAGKAYGPTYTTNDIVGCCVNFINNTIFFTKNGVPLAEAANDIKGLTLYPCVGLRTSGESIEVNFGQKPFVFEISQVFKEEKLKIFKSLQATPTINEEMTSSQLVLGYLMHHGYPETVKLFAKATGTNDNNLDLQLDDIKNRQRISELLLKGDIDKVTAELNRLYPDFLNKRRDILFKLHCQKFIEMIKSEPIEDTMAFGQKELYRFAQESEEYESSLREVFSLIAYQDPYTSPVSHLLHIERREPIVNDLNCALLVHCNKPSTPVLEKIVRQVKVVVNEVIVNNAGPPAVFMNLNEFIEQEDS
ncbi:hypothetical protein SAMD00019534_065860 [Acytostelium subglobosum LB1]|uniref:hypothetical protein n=1 Tax=Acytostelium subglobosum LB1 TaxID=1410327 RepID=UPI00064519E0|nr:hypothetical protein SAMD00019534_065860 [Acytostelium subglobosum LB1]GAM23411.1 hypothetical protein SAMD00019534_065860 [Acytostelium subglobosum LB1]|eukprot:XP_012753860.1 hypothetical protein SAMD00019534_065860 [Acytostelium subglobosum LB1]